MSVSFDARRHTRYSLSSDSLNAGLPWRFKNIYTMYIYKKEFRMPLVTYPFVHQPSRTEWPTKLKPLVTCLILRFYSPSIHSFAVSSWIFTSGIPNQNPCEPRPRMERPVGLKERLQVVAAPTSFVSTCFSETVVLLSFGPRFKLTWSSSDWPLRQRNQYYVLILLSIAYGRW
jgi:hypothetical protein